MSARQPAELLAQRGVVRQTRPIPQRLGLARVEYLAPTGFNIDARDALRGEAPVVVRLVDEFHAVGKVQDARVPQRLAG